MSGQDADREMKPSTACGESEWQTSRRNLFKGAALAASLLVGMTTPAAAAGRKGFLIGLPRFGYGRRARPRPGSTRCFLAGTPILTPRGEVPVESLREGDLVVTLRRGIEPITAVKRTVHGRAAGSLWPEEVRPVRIRQSALGHQIPHCDILVTPAHAIYIDGLLVPAGSLVNGTTIVSETASNRRTLEYYHIETEQHDAVFAAGAPCETLLIEDDATDGPDAVSTLEPFAPIAVYNGGRAKLASRVRSALLPVLDVRTPLDRVRDRLEARAEAPRYGIEDHLPVFRRPSRLDEGRLAG